MQGIDNMYQVAMARKKEPMEGSYTNYLFDKGLEKILKKLGEENTEVIIAAMQGSKEELIGEINDYLYHLVVLMAEKGITPEEVDDVMLKRESKTGNLKPERKEIKQL